MNDDDKDRLIASLTTEVRLRRHQLNELARTLCAMAIDVQAQVSRDLLHLPNDPPEGG